MDISQYLGDGAVLTLVGLCWKMYRDNSKKNCPNTFVERDDCHRDMDELDKNIGRRFEDLKDFIKNGK